MLNSLVLTALVGFWSAHIARKKGYSPLIWFFGGTGLLGLIIVSSLGNTMYLQDEAREAQRRKGNIIGSVMVTVTVLLVILMMSFQ